MKPILMVLALWARVDRPEAKKTAPAEAPINSRLLGRTNRFDKSVMFSSHNINAYWRFMPLFRCIGCVNNSFDDVVR